MALVSGLLLLMLSILFVEARTQPNQFGEIHLGSQLSPISNLLSWQSPSGNFAFGFYSQGNGFAVGTWMMGQPNNTVIWTANRDDEPVSFNATIHLSEEGKLLLRTEQGNEKLIANVSEIAASASMLDSACRAQITPVEGFSSRCRKMETLSPTLQTALVNLLMLTGPVVLLETTRG